MGSVHSALKKISDNKRGVEGIAHSVIEGLVSVCIPNYNKAKYLRDCILSVVKQSYTNIEIIFVDDCSSDGSWKVVQNFRREFPSIKFVMLQLPYRRGTAWAQNMAYYLARGEFIMNMDSDDIIHKDKIALQTMAMTELGYDLCGTNFQIFRSDVNNPLTRDGGHWLKYDSEDIENSYLFDRVHCVCFGTVMYKHYVIEALGGMNKEYIGTEDYEIIHRAATKGFKIGNVKNPLYFYRSNETQRSKLFHS